MLKILFSLGYAGDFNVIRKKAKDRVFGKFWYPIYKLYMIRHGSYIPLTCEMNGPIKFVHLQGIFISSTASIGKNCIIYQQVTIGSNRVPTSKTFGSPQIGNNCIIGAGAKIIGGITIGNDVKIGAGCVVFEDIPDSSTVVSSKPRIIKKNT